MRPLLAMLLLCGVGCIDRTRLNAECAWIGDTPFQLNLADATHRRHLTADAQLAEGVAVRYADTEHRRRFGYGGHGGLVDHGAVLHACFDTLVAKIEHNHGVTRAEIDAARAQRDLRFDAPVLLSFAVVYVVAALFVNDWIRRHFGVSPRATFAMTAAASIVGSVVGLQLAAIWGGVWETVRIGDDHFGSFRAARAPSGGYLPLRFAAGVLLFWIAAAGVQPLRVPIKRGPRAPRNDRVRRESEVS
jgi:hypothetical protein